MGFAECFLYPFRPLLRYVENPEDTKDDRFRKNLLIPASLWGVVSSLVFAAQGANRGAYLAAATAVAQNIEMVIFLCYVLLTKRCPQGAAGLLATVYGLLTLSVEIWTYGLIGYYSVAVIVMDVLLLCNCNKSFTIAMYWLTIAIILICWVEQFYRTFGIYDAIPESWSGYKRPEQQEGEVAANFLMARIFVFTVDFLMTRYFSKGMREQVERSVVVAQRIASALARFDLDKAEEMVEGAEGLPLELLDALTCLLGNLRTYRPYLPQSCLPGEVEEQGSELPSETASLVSSTTPSRVTEELVPVTPALRGQQLARRCVTLVQSNICGFLSEGRTTVAIAETHATYISGLLEAAKQHRGIIDHFTCDRVLVSFNAARHCLSHRYHGVLFAVQLRTLPDFGVISAGVTSGEVLSGALGCDGLKSYSVVGLTAAWVPLLERLSRHFAVDIVTDSSVARHAADTCDFRLLGDACFDKRPEDVVELFEVMGTKAEKNVEWMYVVGEQSLWTVYNLSKRLLQEGDAQGAELHMTNLRNTGNKHVDVLVQQITKAVTSGPFVRTYWEISDVGISENKGKPDVWTD